MRLKIRSSTECIRCQPSAKGDSKSTRNIFEPPRVKTNKMVCAPSEDSDQPGHPPNLIRVFAVRVKKDWVLSYPLSAQQRLIRLGSFYHFGQLIFALRRRRSIESVSNLTMFYMRFQVLWLYSHTIFTNISDKLCLKG